jgi:hypothetical protein
MVNATFLLFLWHCPPFDIRQVHHSVDTLHDSESFKGSLYDYLTIYAINFVG